MAPALHSPVSTLARAALWAATTTLRLTLVACQHPVMDPCYIYEFDEIADYCRGAPGFPESIGFWDDTVFVCRRWCEDCQEADKKHGIFTTCGSDCNFFGFDCDVCRKPYRGVMPVTRS